MASERELSLDPILDRHQPQLLQAPRLQPRERPVLDIGERPPPPQRLRVAQRPRGRHRVVALERDPPVCDELLERVQVELARLHAQHVPGRTGQ